MTCRDDDPRPPEVLLQHDGVLGEVVLRRRPPRPGEPGEGVVELIVNGTFLMDTVDTTTEALLATAALTRHHDPRRVLVGGLGLGWTAAAVLADARVHDLVVAEIEPVLADAADSGLLPGAAAATLRGDPRCRVVTGDVAAVAAQEAGPPGWDVVLLDVDNGPDFLVHARNAALYAAPALTRLAATLAEGGLLAVWSADRSPALAATLTAAVGPVEELLRQVHRQGRELTYAIYLARRPRDRRDPAGLGHE